MHLNEISDEEWRQLAPVLSDTAVVHGQRGRPRAQVRLVANAVLWILTTGESWSRLPGTYPSIPTCRLRFEKWRSSGALATMHKLLSDAGRTLRCGPDGRPEIRHATPRVIDRQPKDEGLRQVFWKDQASWQTPRDTQPPHHTVDRFAQIARQLPNISRTLPERISPHAPIERPQSILRTASPWMGLASKGKCEFDPRGYVIYLAADPVASARFRGWAEIVRDARRVARSGLIGPSFRNIEAAQQYAFEWARRWIDEASGDNSEHVDEVGSDVWQRKVRSG
ncbi:transposase [Paraburkholderia haematera]|uniref:transposase n=1 Tax=Paraburkholderia haematera TaxID=2793077 RepID=UPI001F305075|nr:transposase [Paraburkholderia haematera]